jgi:hypothetical protein
MREETKVFIETVAKKRAERIQKDAPDLETKLAMDESGLKGAL